MKKLPDGSIDITEEFRSELGWTAGRLWHYLGEHGKVPIETLFRDYKKIVTPELIEFMGPKMEIKWDVLMAMGWLACEGKIIIYEDIRTHKWISACLEPVEQDIYRKAHYK